ncbi:hypothetical protein CK203_096567 [Vitis vinifera]|uniref:Uncharacterized protein n=1 Tax=Vitis vinifera TaxID=29760 RepID=A0A438E3M9_VITVI|nr:hypothetical protein CK203_096567 [Vitis vinifera]
MRQLRVSDGSTIWDDLEGMPVASLPAKFRMPDIKRYTGIGRYFQRFMDRFSPSDVKGKKPFRGKRSVDVSAIDFANQRPFRRHMPVPQLLETHHFYAPHQYRPRAPRLELSKPLLLCFEDAEAVFTVRYAIEPGSSEAYRGRISSRGGISIDGHCRATVEPLTFPHYSVQMPFVLIPDVDEVQAPYVDDVHTSDVQYVIRGGRQVPSVLLDNNSTLNVCPLAIAIAIGYAPSDFGRHSAVVGDMFISVELVLQINHSDDDLLLTGFTFDEGMSYLPGMGLGRRQHGPREGDGSLTHTPFDYIVHPYTLSLIDYFVRASEPQTPLDGIIGGLSTTEEAELQHRLSFMTLCFSDEIDEHEIFAEIGDIVDGAVPHDEYVNEMLAMSLSQIEEIVSLELISPFDLFGVSILEIARRSRLPQLWKLLRML